MEAFCEAGEVAAQLVRNVYGVDEMIDNMCIDISGGNSSVYYDCIYFFYTQGY